MRDAGHGIKRRDDPSHDGPVHFGKTFFRAVLGVFASTFCQAIVNALFSVVASALARRTLVAPPLPQPPGTGRKISGSASTTIDCCSGVSFTIPHSLSG